MTKGLQKTEKSLSELDIPHPGILNLESFNKHFELHCYEPCEELKPFVVHIWTQRHRTRQAKNQQTIEVFSGPNIYLFFTQKRSFIRGIASDFDAEPRHSSVMAGVKFQPGGFYAFWQKSLRELENTTMPLNRVFPEVNDDFTKKLLKQSDQDIVRTLEKLLLEMQPHYDKKLEIISQVLKIAKNDPSSQSVKNIAKTFGRSERSLQLLFRHRVGIPLKWVVMRQRLLHTIHQVRSTRSSWTNIVAESGYSNQSHFTREFKEAIGLSPSQYKKAVQKSINNN